MPYKLEFGDSDYLVVDDMNGIRNSLKYFLKHKECFCETAENGIEALSLLEQTNTSVSIASVTHEMRTPQNAVKFTANGEIRIGYSLISENRIKI